MRIRKTAGREEDQSRIEMSSMTDVVFLLLIFFVMTFQVTAVEGDVSINTADAAGPDDRQVDPPRNVVLHVRLISEENGDLAGVRLDGRHVGSIEDLGTVVQVLTENHLSAGGAQADLAVDLRSDQSLKYQFTIDAITSIRGGEGNGARLGIENIRLVAVR